ncbi:nuclear protein localization protein 4 [Polyrhizophydium stewartii]|uniref:Nuclear protein localization protein 4 n=1 Tax=Polyrhizophydium stewartii TaxID=2732419 RepID=A0ABR4NAD1_9FUNG|nr:nuclear protein localization protein 4 [Polyrhizophydium stewartii]
MLVRIRAPEGQARITAEATDTLASLLAKIATALKYDPAKSFGLALDPKGDQRLPATPGAALGALGIKHGDLLFVHHAPGAPQSQPQPKSDKPLPAAFVKQDAVDDFLEKQPGTIKRGRDARFCKHGSSGMCEYCLPLQPYDAKYLEENKIKHMSFHAYLRQRMELSKTPPVTSPHFIPPLDTPDFKNFRMVDHIEFESPALIDNFLQFWRSTGVQRAGILYGRYEPYAEVPLGVKAVVSAIYEPLQDGGHDTIQLAMPDPSEETVDGVAASLGLVRVGVVYTDLTDDGTGKGTVVCKRHADSYFLSSAECIFASHFQAKYPMATKYSPTRTFGSRFVTCVISGNEEGGIDIFSYQFSNMCVAMAQDNIIEASTDPALMRVCESTDKQYVPEVFYKYKNEYNLMVQNAAKPTFPVEYLLVTVTHGFPSTPSPTFKSVGEFPTENRIGMGKARDMSALKQQLSGSRVLDALSDFHALLYVKEAGILDQSDFDLLTQAIRTQSEELVVQLAHRSSWQTLQMILQEISAAAAGAGGAGSSSGGPSAAPKACQYCTFVNPAGTDTCEMCGLPLDQ